MFQAFGLPRFVGCAKLGRMPRIAGLSSLYCLGLGIGAVWFGCVLLGGEPDWTPMERDYVQTTWTRESGLPSNTIYHLAQTRDGYLWLATRGGLVRFDGARFVVFDRGNTGAMSSQDCRVLVEDRGGALWIGTSEGLIRRWGTNMEKVPIEGHSDVIDLMASSRQGGIWAAVGDTIYRVRMGDNGEWRSDACRAPGTVRGLQEDTEGVLWALTDEGLAQWRPQPGLWEAEKIIGATRVGTLALGPDGCLYALRYAGVYSQSSGGWAYYRSQFPVEDFRDPETGRDRFLVFDGAGGLWLNAGQRGLDRLAGDVWTRYSWPFGEKHDAALCMLADREGNLWVGCENTGLHQLRRRAITTLTRADGLPDDSAWAVLGASDGSLWVGTDRGVARFQGGECRTWTEAEGLTRSAVRAMAEDARGRIWVGTGSSLNVIDGDRLIAGRLPGDWYHTKVRVLRYCRSGLLWVGTVTGLYAIDPDGVEAAERDAGGEPGRSTVFKPIRHLGEAEGLPAVDVRDVLEDRQGRLWIGTYGGGLVCHDQGQVSVFNMRDSLTSDFVWALHEDPEGVLWVGTEGGLNRLKDGKITAFTRAQGLPENLVNAMIEDTAGNLWIGHDFGLYRVRKHDLHRVAEGYQAAVEPVEYDELDGLRSLQINGQKSQPAAGRLPDRRLCFCTAGGLAIFQPDALPDIPVTPLVAIDQIRGNGQLLYDSGPAGRLTGGSLFSAGQELRLGPGTGRVLEIGYTAAAFVSGNKTRFRYRLDGVDATWIDAGTSRRAYYANLKPGRYRFHLAARNKHGAWSQDQVVASFLLLPHLYETGWFRVGCATGLAGLVWLGLAWRVREVRRLNRLEAEASLGRERARLARDLHDGLGANLTQLMLLTDQAEAPATQARASPSRGQLDSLARTTHETLHTLREIIWATHPTHDTLESLVQRIGQYAEDFLQAAGVGCRLELPLSVPATALSSELRSELFYAVKEALHNVVKHARATQVRLQVTCADRKFRVSIEDDGRGFEPGSSSGSAPRPGWPRHGLVNMEERLKAVGGRFTCSSRPGAGTVVRLELPLSP